MHAAELLAGSRAEMMSLTRVLCKLCSDCVIGPVAPGHQTYNLTELALGFHPKCHVIHTEADCRCCCANKAEASDPAQSCITLQNSMRTQAKGKHVHERQAAAIYLVLCYPLMLLLVQGLCSSCPAVKLPITTHACNII